jgi:hypothetical protein
MPVSRNRRKKGKKMKRTKRSNKVGRIGKKADEFSAEEMKGLAPADEAVAAFLAEHPGATDEQFHEWAEENGYNIHKAEQKAYELAAKFSRILESGRAKEKGTTAGKVDSKELAMGMEVEKEHTPDPETAKRIALDHLAELPDYYTRLKKMETGADVKLDKKAFMQGYLTRR